MAGANPADLEVACVIRGARVNNAEVAKRARSERNFDRAGKTVGFPGTSLHFASGQDRPAFLEDSVSQHEVRVVQIDGRVDMARQQQHAVTDGQI